MRLILLVWLLAAACSAASPAPIWGPSALLGQAEQQHAPALWVENARLTAAWTDANVTTVYFAARAITPTGPTDTAILALPAHSPRDLRLLPAHGADLNLLWLDTDDSGSPRLYTGRFTPDLEVVGNFTRISNRPTYHYAAVPNGDDTVWLTWSGGSPAEPALYAQLLNRGSRPLDAQFLITDASWPALSRANDGTLYLYWRQVSDGQLYGGVLLDGQLQDMDALGIPLELRAGEALHGLYAGLDRTHRYLFWTITGADGNTHTRYTTAPLTDTEWSAVAELAITLDTTATLETDFNTGPAERATAGTTPVTWAKPMDGQFDLLPMAAAIGDDVGIVYMQSGEVVAAQIIAPTDLPHLIGYPALTTNRERNLYLAWAQPHHGTAADLRLKSLGLNWQAETPPGTR